MSLSDEVDEIDKSSHDRRKVTREYVIWRIGLLYTGNAMDFCCVKNISSDGFMARIYNQLSVGDQIHIEMKSGQLLPGSVVWHRDKHVGVSFRDHIDVEATLSNQQVIAAGHLPRLPRIEVNCRIRLRSGSRHHTGRLWDISQGGAQIQTATLLSPIEPVSLLLRDFPPVPSSVRWSRGTRAGISFNESVRLESLVDWIQAHRADRSSGLPLDLGAEEPPPAQSRQGDGIHG